MASRENDASVSSLLRAIPPEFRPEVGDGVVRIARDGEAWSFRPVWVGEGLPADARRASGRIDRRIDEQRGTIPVVTARRLSRGAQEILEAEQLSWADASGRAHLVVPGRLYVTRLEPSRVEPTRGFAWSAAADAIAETLLTWRMRGGSDAGALVERVAAVAEAADVSLPHTARVLRQFDEQGYTAKTGAERGSSATREFRDPGRMLSDWVGQYAASGGPGQAIEYHVPWREPERSTSLLSTALAGSQWAVTGEAAADRIAPFLTGVSTLDVYVPARGLALATERLGRERDLTEVASGGRIRLYPAQPHVFRLAEGTDGVSLASAVRVYADLVRQRGRSAEAGEHLREVVIGF